MPDWVVTVIYGIVEGITEFLPISSTGHLLLLQHFLGVSKSEFFNIGIQAGAVLAVVFVYWKRLLDLVVNFRQPEERDYILKLVAAFGVTAVLGLIAKKLGFELPDDPWPIALALWIGGLLIFVAEWKLKGKQGLLTITWQVALIVGAAQVLAGVFPGTSRSAATIIAAMVMGLSRVSATEFSFLLGIPTMFAAAGYDGLKEIKKNGGLPPQAEMLDFALGFVVSMVVAFIVIKWLLVYVRSHTFNPFAWYRVVLGLGLIVWLSIHG
jgi:undecaprenyl-diphosphatase